MKVLYWITLSCLIVACEKEEQPFSIPVVETEIYEEDQEYVTVFREKRVGEEAPKLTYRYVDSTSLGQPGSMKVELIEYSKSIWNSIVCVHLYRKSDNWKLIQKIAIPKDTPGTDPIFGDYNGDGFIDMQVHTGDAARGANERRTLLLYNGKRDRLLYLHNSDYYPNLEYNPKTTGLTSWAFHAGTHTWFLQVQGDSLVKEAIVEPVYQGGTELTIYDRHENIILDTTLSIQYEVGTRFTNYHPIDAQ